MPSGGARPNAGRPKGSQNLRTIAATELVARARERFPTYSPIEALIALAENSDDPSLQKDCHAAVLPYMAPRYRPIEADPNALVELEGRMIRARLDAVAQASEVVPGLAERLQRAMAAEALHIAENPQLMDATPPVDTRPAPSPAPQVTPAPKPAAFVPPAPPAPFVDYRPVLPRSSSRGVDFVECEYDPTGGSYDLP